MAKLVSLINVAREAGVSLTTASRVLNKSSHPVNTATALRVIEAAERLGYSPSALARALATQRSGIIGVLVGDNTDPYFASIVSGIHATVRERGSLVIECNTLRNPMTELEYIAMLDSYRADGILLVGGALMDQDHPKHLQAACERYTSNGGRIISLSERPLQVPSVMINNVQASYDMAQYLISIGHRKIAYVRGPHNLRTTALRYEGFCRATSEAGIPHREEYLVDGNFSFEGGVAAMERLLRHPELPTAVFAANDVTAIGCLVTALQHGLRVPEDISIAGMDNILATQFVTPQLTTIDVPMVEMGKQAALCLFAMIDGETVPQVSILPHSLIVRGTTAPHRTNGP